MTDSARHRVVAEVRSWLDDSGLLGGDDFAVLGGSLAAGLGNQSSDVDIYVVRGGPSDCSLEGQQLFLDDRRMDCHELTLDQLIKAIDHLAVAVDQGEEPLTAQVVLVHRVVDGVHLGGRPAPESLRRRGRGVVRSALLLQTRLELCRVWTDMAVASALLDTDSYRAAVIDFVETSLYGALAHVGSTYPNVKWNWEKLSAMSGHDGLRRGIEQLQQLLSEGMEQSDDIEKILAELGIDVRLPERRFFPRRSDKLRSFAVGTTIYLVLGDHAFIASPAVVALLADANGEIELTELLDQLHERYDTSADRLVEDARHAMRSLQTFGLLGLATSISSAVSEPPEAPEPVLFEPSLTPVGSIQELLPCTYRVWRTWVEYLSHRDDLAGAIAAGQIGATAAAARRTVRDLVSIHLYQAGSQHAPGAELAGIRHRIGEESSLYRELLALWHTTASTSDVASVERRLELLEGELIDNVQLVLQGNLRDEDGHTALFVQLRQLLEMAAQLGVVIPVSAQMVEKSRRYGQTASLGA